MPHRKSAQTTGKTIPKAHSVKNPAMDFPPPKATALPDIPAGLKFPILPEYSTPSRIVESASADFRRPESGNTRQPFQGISS